MKKQLGVFLLMIMTLPLAFGQKHGVEGVYVGLENEHLKSGNHYAGFALHRLLLDSSSYFRLTVDYPTACGQVFPTDLAEGVWQKVGDAILLKPLIKKYSLFEEITQKQYENRGEVIVKIKGRFNEHISGLQVRFYTKDERDFIVLYTNDKGEITIPSGTYIAFDLLKVSWTEREKATIAIDQGEIQLQLNVRNTGSRMLGMPENTIVEVKKDGSLVFEKFRQNLTFKQVDEYSWQPWQN